MKKLFTLLTAVLLFATFSSAQVTVSIPEITLTAQGGAVKIPLNVTNFNNVGAVTLKISYDPAVLTFQGTPNPLGSNFAINATNGTLVIGWFNTTPLNVGSNKLLDLNFQHIAGNSNLSFLTQDCEIANASAQAMAATFQNGKVNCVPVGNQKSSLGGTVWNDLNKNGIQDTGEPGLQWVTAELFDCNNAWKAWVSTDATGNYVFADLTAGDYYVKFYLIDDYKDYNFTTKDAGTNDEKDSDVETLTDSSGKTSCITLAAGVNNLSVDAGVIDAGVPVINYSSIGNNVWNDKNKNGLQDNGETGMENVTVKLTSCDLTVLKTTHTNSSGIYSFDSLTAGNYGIQFEAPSGYKFSPKNAGSNLIDSDPDAIHGQVDCFALAAGTTNTSIDAGLYKDSVIAVHLGSMGDKVFVDANKNGVQDNGEAGLAWVTVELFDCNNAWKGFTVTGQNGEYLFDSLAAGDYYLKFHLIGNNSNYRFTTSNITSLSDTVGKTACINLTAGENDLTQDVGVCEKTTSTGSPCVFITKDDGKSVMPDTGKTTTYTISYGNTGTVPLLNAAITDSLPDGVEYTSATGGGVETASGSNIVTFALGTINAGANGSVTVKVTVTSSESEYLNMAYISGKDGNNNTITGHAQDLNFADSTSGGCGSGVESRGDLAELLLRREWKIRNGLTTPVLAKSSANSVSSAISLQQIVPQQGPYNSYAVETTPFDILGISNAVSSYAVDYNLSTSEGVRRVGGIFSTTTIAPNIYDHTKVVCDRLAGSAIEEIKLVDINGLQFFAAKLRKSAGKITDYAISFSVYETPSGYYVENKWTYEEYKAPAGASTVFNFQAWSSSYDGSVSLVKQILTNLAAHGSIRYMNSAQSNPDVFIKSTRYTHDGNVHLTLVNTGSQLKPVTLNSYLRYSQGDELIQSTSTVNAEPGESEAVLPLGIISDAQVQLSLSTGFKDEIFVSGGAYTYVNGSASTVMEFKTIGYPQLNLSSYPEGTIMLAGGAYVAGSVNDWVTVIRALSTNGTPYNLRTHGQVRFEAKGTGVVTVILDMANVNNYNYFARTITLSPQNQEYIVNFSDFSQLNGSDVKFDAGQIRAVGFIFNTANNPGLTNFNFEVKNIGFLTAGATSVNSNKTVPTEFNLSQNYPNPFNPSTIIEYSVPVKELVTLKVYNTLGQEVANLVNEELQPGKYSVNFNAANLSSGVYFYRLHGNSVNITKKMTFTK